MINRDDILRDLIRQKRAEERERHNANREAFADWLNATSRKPVDPFIATSTDGRTAAERKEAGIAALDAFINGLPEEQPETPEESAPELPEESAPEVRDGGEAATEYREPKKNIAERIAEKLDENSLTDDGNPWHRL